MAPTTVSDQPSMIRRAVEGDETALDRLCRDYRTVVLRFARHMQPGAGEDQVNEILLKVLQLLRDPKREFDKGFGEKFTAWLYSVSENVLRQQRRKRRTSEISIDKPGPNSDSGSFRPREPVSRRTSPTLAAVRQEMHRMIQARLRLLPPLYRDAIRMHWLEGRSTVEIGRRLGIDETTVRKRLQRAHERLRSMLTRTQTTLHRLTC
jgi:RNA polymerase sigma-70 factor (ECF subfamily)